MYGCGYPVLGNSVHLVRRIPKTLDLGMESIAMSVMIDEVRYEGRQLTSEYRERVTERRNMKIVVIGGTGLIVPKLVRQLREQDSRTP